MEWFKEFCEGEERLVLLVVKEITEYNVWLVSVVVCVWWGGWGEEYRWVVL